jgi:hypothetical protein
LALVRANELLGQQVKQKAVLPDAEAVWMVIRERPLRKDGNPAEQFVTWVQENEYNRRGEESRYILELRLTQGPGPTGVSHPLSARPSVTNHSARLQVRASPTVSNRPSTESPSADAGRAPDAA